jgi:hypothetical protein
MNAQQNLQVEGYIKDSLTKEPLAGVSVYLRGTTIGTSTNIDGHFSFKATSDSTVLAVSYIGYEDYFQTLKRVTNKVNILLSPTVYQLSDIVVRPHKEKYVKKGNPAVEFIEEVIKRRKLNNPRDRDFFSYETYEQKSFARNDFEKKDSTSNKPLSFLSEYADTSVITGKPILPLFNEEIIDYVYYRRHPRTEKHVVEGYKRAGMIEFLPEEGVKPFLEEVFKEVDIFQDNIPLFLLRFVSPLSSIGPNYYRYYMMDTVVMDNVKYLDMGFAPFNSESYGFTGHLYITLDSTFFIRKAVLNVPRHINVNFVQHMTIEQDYERTADSTRLTTKNDIIVEFNISDKTKGLYARRICLYKNHSFDPPEDEGIFKEKAPVIELAQARKQPEPYWDEKRGSTTLIQKNSVEEMMARLREVPVFFWTEKVVGVLINGYAQTSATNSKFEIGPANTFISGNSLEGARFRLGGATTVNLSNQWFADGYLAYGARDGKFKGDAIFEYTFNKKKSFRKEYPHHYLRAEYRYDINQIGQHYLYTNADNIFMMLKRRENNLITYMQTAELSYYHEHYNGWGYGAVARHLTEWATEHVPFDKIQADGSTTPVGQYRSTQLELKLRWAPNEKFYESRNYRYPITIDAPTITLSHIVANKGFLGSDYNYNRTEIGIRKRFWLSPFGYINLYGQAGKVWSKVPYPMLIIPNANLSYTIEPESYTLLDPMEFINDRFVSWEATYFMNGLILNRLPLVKKLKLREIVAFRGWYGDLSDKNNPWKNGAGIYVFPGNTYLMNDTPYMELSFGVENILKFIRLDYVSRLSYRNHPGTPNNGIRVRMEFSF